jgi:hypothetical protein
LLEPVEDVLGAEEDRPLLHHPGERLDRRAAHPLGALLELGLDREQSRIAGVRGRLQVDELLVETGHGADLLGLELLRLIERARGHVDRLAGEIDAFEHHQRAPAAGQGAGAPHVRQEIEPDAGEAEGEVLRGERALDPFGVELVDGLRRVVGHERRHHEARRPRHEDHRRHAGQVDGEVHQRIEDRRLEVLADGAAVQLEADRLPGRIQPVVAVDLRQHGYPTRWIRLAQSDEGVLERGLERGALAGQPAVIGVEAPGQVAELDLDLLDRAPLVLGADRVADVGARPPVAGDLHGHAMKVERTVGDTGRARQEGAADLERPPSLGLVALDRVVRTLEALEVLLRGADRGLVATTDVVIAQIADHRAQVVHLPAALRVAFGRRARAPVVGQ